MSEYATTCDVHSCDKPSDGWFVCEDCASTFKWTLSEIPWLIDQLNTVITQQTRYVDQSSSGKSAETPMMFNVKASETKGQVLNELDTSARIIAEANGWPLTYTTATGCSIWLEHRISAIRLSPSGGDIVSRINSQVAMASWVIDRPAQRQFLGDCDVDAYGQACGGRIYGRAGKPEAACDTCGGIYQADALRTHLLGKLDDRLCTASEIANLSTYLGLDLGRDQVRKRINQWHSRSQITAHQHHRIHEDGTSETVTAFKFGDVLPMLSRHETKRAGA